jgi:hypothetical protein
MNAHFEAPWLASSTLEKLLEHRFLADLTTHLWCRGTRDFDVLHPEVDTFGHDLVIECQGIIRHIQLKAMVRNGKRRDVGVSLALAGRPSACVIWMLYDPVTLRIGPFLWFGASPGEPLPSPGVRIGRHTKGNAQGCKAERPGIRLLPRSKFERLDTIDLLAERLFGLPQGTSAIAVERQMQLLRDNVPNQPQPELTPWLQRVQAGDFEVIPRNLSWGDSVELAHLIDGYELVKRAGWADPFRFAETRLALATLRGEWSGGPAELWISLFLEHRRWRMAGREPDPPQREILDRLTRTLGSVFVRSVA